MEEEEIISNISECFNYSYADAFIMEDLANRTILLNSEIDASVIEGIVYHILRYNRIDRDVPIEDRKPIMLYLNSPGGSVCDGFGLIDAITTSLTPVYTVNLGRCDSMAFMLFISGRKRYCMPHGEFLMHDGMLGGQDSTAKMRDRIEFETVEIENEIKEYVLSHTKITNKLYKEKYRCEFYFLPHKAKELGVVDYIVGEDCDISEIL